MCLQNRILSMCWIHMLVFSECCGHLRIPTGIFFLFYRCPYWFVLLLHLVSRVGCSVLSLIHTIGETSPRALDWICLLFPAHQYFSSVFLFVELIFYVFHHPSYFIQLFVFLMDCFPLSFP